MKKLLLKALLIFCFIFCNGCIEDKITPPFTGQLNPTAEMLVYFESTGDYINSNLAPALIEAPDVFSNRSNYLIIDLRSNPDFQNGHIEGSINISNDSLISYLKSMDAVAYPKIILVSKNGQSSAYFTCLLRLAGFSNVYSMKYGMASWNHFFSDEWLDALSDATNILDFNNNDVPKNNLTDLPLVTFNNPNESLPDRVNSRIQQIFEEGFFYSDYLPNGGDDYVICYGKMRLYYARKFIAFDGRGHAPGAVSYLDSPDFEFSSNKYLQSLPNNLPIFIYDYDGQLSACVTAYLRVLGYNASSLRFGANQLFYSRLIDEPELREYAFSSLKIYNFPFITGN
jgi:rhodanese-related sulfurtransferase